MKISINQFFTKAGFSYPFTGIFVGWVSEEVGKRIKLSKPFVDTYSRDHTLMFFVDARPNIATTEIHGPKLHRRDKEVQFTVVLPHPGGPESKEPAAYVEPVRLILESMAAALRKIDLDASEVVRDIPELIQQFLINAKMIYTES